MCVCVCVCVCVWWRRGWVGSNWTVVQTNLSLPWAHMVVYWGAIRPRHTKTCLREYADSKCPDQLVHPHTLIRTFTVWKQNHWMAFRIFQWRANVRIRKISVLFGWKWGLCSCECYLFIICHILTHIGYPDWPQLTRPNLLTSRIYSRSYLGISWRATLV